MASKYPRSLRGCLPLWTLLLQAALIVIFFFFASYDSFIQYPEVVTQGAILQDMVVMAALGLGFLSSSLWRYSWSSVAFNLFMLALGVQWAVLLDGFLEHPRLGKVFIELSRIQQATMTAMSVLISAGAILGKANLAQLVLLVLMEVTAFSATRMISQQFLSTHIHNAVLAGGVAVGAPCHLIPSPWLAMVLGLLAGLISIGGAKSMPVCFNRVLGIHDTCGVHYTFGLPGLLGGITYIAYLTSWFKDPLCHLKPQNMESSSCG
uniref:Ammonium transporter AmtB-like domain-containing protein n=1 Tax=Pipistrellus kuhlii TaxID=59472 RepID=A0A7J8A870_PIPKU|nr:hypothetical protein mPipKuh1_009042 [Pipistrellus kuhlii]